MWKAPSLIVLFRGKCLIGLFSLSKFVLPSLGESLCISFDWTFQNGHIDRFGEDILWSLFGEGPRQLWDKLCKCQVWEMQREWEWMNDNERMTIFPSTDLCLFGELLVRAVGVPFLAVETGRHRSEWCSLLFGNKYTRTIWTLNADPRRLPRMFNCGWV